MSDQRTAALEYARQNKGQSLKLLESFLRIPSVSTESGNQPDVQRAAKWVAAQLSGLGMQNVQIYPTARHPVVYAEWLGAHPQTAGARNAPTVLIYGHYDVQPADPLDLWQTGPFEPAVRGENLYARGASDMKGQVVAAMQAVYALVETGGLPVNLKWLIEGEEEIGSPSLETFIADHKELLASDFALNPDSGMIGPDDPTITYALRGLAYFELRVYGPASDLHSGLYGGVVHNPANALAELIARRQRPRHAARLLRQDPPVERGRARRAGPPADGREAFPGADRRAGFIWRSWLHPGGTRRCAPHAGCQRHVVRLYRRGVEDGHPGLGDGEDLHAPRP